VSSRTFAGQTLQIPDVTGAVSDTFGDAHWIVKLLAIVAVLYVGMDLVGRWTGHYVGNINFLGLNPIGEQINASQQTLSQQRAGSGGAGFNRVHSQ
jgi:hypothetical protein